MDETAFASLLLALLLVSHRSTSSIQRDQILSIYNVLILMTTVFDELVNKFPDRYEIKILLEKIYDVTGIMSRFRPPDKEVCDTVEEEKLASLKEDLKAVITVASVIWVKIYDIDVPQVHSPKKMKTSTARVDTANRKG
ncbi:unnamed protein product [Ilex paraguariensis]|uniref:Uncharacterized protein n=1 Tax=Ilex paraguariensis TaxID=185542 RepID=A0ABC8QVK9_9AQUA